MSAVYKVEGMDCGGCVKAVTRSIQGHAPDAQVSVELESGLVTVNGDISAQAVQEAVTAAGFTFHGQQ